MRLIEKIILLLLGISLMPLLIIGLLFYSSVKSTLEKETIGQLSSIATIQEHRLVDIRSQNLTRLSDFTSRRQLRALVDRYNQTGDTGAQTELNAALNDTKTLRKDIRSISILNTKGEVIGSSEKDTLATQRAESEAFKAGMRENFARLVGGAEEQETFFRMSGPFILNGKLIGVAVMETNAAELLKTLTDHTGLGETGEIYMGHRLENGQLAYITARRFESPKTSRIVSDNTVPMYKALAGEEAVFLNIKDYRGEPVFAVTRSIDDSGWGLVTKIDNTEALRPLNHLRSELILLAFINSVLVVFTAIALARRLTQPILEIDEVAELTSRGDLKKRVANPSNDEIGNLAETFNNMLDNLEVFDKAKTDFVSLASHQLRTPLTSIKWSAEALIDPKIALSQTKQKKYLQQIHDSNERMIELVGSLLNVSKIDVGTLPFTHKSVEPTQTIEHVISDLKVLIQTKNVTINKKIDDNLAPIYIDPNWLHVILQNLLSNAIRYSPPKHEIDIIVEQQPEHIIIKVADKGYGIPKSQQKNIFSKFFRADNAKKLGSDGSGLGLYLTKAMVERARGNIWFDSIEGKGSTFYVKLPIRNQELNGEGDN